MRMLELHAREVLGMPDSWALYYFEKGRANSDVPEGMIKIKGCIAPLKSNGSHDWRKSDKSSERIHFFNLEEHRAWIKEWEKRTGKCADCLGSGKVVKRISFVDKVTEYMVCPKCQGTRLRKEE